MARWKRWELSGSLLFYVCCASDELMGVLGGVGIGLQSLDALIAALPPNTLPEFIEQLLHAGHGHSHAPIVGADPLALWVAGGSIGIKEWLYRASTSSGHEKSTNLQPRKSR